MNALRELLTMLLDSVKHGDLTGHLRAWRLVATGRITPDTTAADCAPTILAFLEYTEYIRTQRFIHESRFVADVLDPDRFLHLVTRLDSLFPHDHKGHENGPA